MSKQDRIAKINSQIVIPEDGILFDKSGRKFHVKEWTATVETFGFVTITVEMSTFQTPKTEVPDGKA